ncbi:MAG: dihydrolipoyl dehydrogenase [Clostridiales bacterium]|nr:dihydrolipoyl dehydrogenase [Clostridiales bacterium]
MENFDLIIIGAGPGGYEAAVDAAKQYNMKVALVENRELGGTCLNRGCIPTKTMLYSASLYHEIKTHGDEIGLTGAEDDGYDMAKIQYRKQAVVAQLRAGVETLMKMNKINVFYGTGTIMDKTHVRVAGVDGVVTDLEAKNIMIATGSIPSVPPIKGADLDGVVTSDHLLNQDKPLESLVIIGGGVIGMEFASVFSSLGTKVTVIEALDRIIANMDKEICQSLKMLSKKKGIDIHTGSMVTEIKGSTGDMTVCYTEKEKPCEVSGQLVLLAIGRRAYTEGLFANESSDEVKNMSIERGKITVDGRYETSVPGIYAIGDVTGGIQLAHVATGEGRSAVAYMNNSHPSIDMTIVPSCIYTHPEIASVGLSGDEVKKQGLKVITHKYAMGSNGKSILSLQERGFIKIIADEDTHKVLGAQMMCARATDMISQFSQAIVSGLTLEEMSKTIYPHPSFSEGIGEALK